MDSYLQQVIDQNTGLGEAWNAVHSATLWLSDRPWLLAIPVALLIVFEYFTNRAQHTVDMLSSSCGFCRAAHGAPVTRVVREWPDAIALVPIEPVVDGHIVVIPRKHVCDAGKDPRTTARVMRRVAELVAELGHANVITSKGVYATQTAFHLHVHVVPREEGDDLPLPWTFQVREGADS